VKRFSQYPAVAWVRTYKKPLAIIIIALSLVLLAIYTLLHPELITNLMRTDPRVLVILCVLYGLIVVSQLFIMLAVIRLCGKQLAFKRGVLLSIYSTLINFFGPLQSGPSARAVYLKAAIKLRIRDYILATMYYYFAFGAISGSLLFMNTVPILTVLGIVLSIIITIAGTKKLHLEKLSKYIFIIYIVTVLQVLITVTIYYLELNVTSSTHYSTMQAFVYTASANLSMFVSITPGAIGIREAFVVFAQSLHHIPLVSIVAAGVLDRAFYIVFLFMLFIFTSGIHLQDMFSRKESTKIIGNSV
jgi:uncharacterized membrane protein YbhN (UPF0104 family)